MSAPVRLDDAEDPSAASGRAGPRRSLPAVTAPAGRVLLRAAAAAVLWALLLLPLLSATW
ncbi:hypothetical protein GCM10010466_66550 [Planomonospora alba]|uniref:ABC transporter permease n=1 Tax=Planomonospora alba TaxID=161354 RepID=A0ABP6P4R8_9ACTN